MKKTTKLLSLTAVGAFAFTLVGCGGSKTVDEYRGTYATTPSTFNALIANQQPNSMHITNFIDGLVEVDNYGAQVPGLAEAIPAPVNNADGTQTWTFKIKSGIEWQIFNPSSNKLENFKVDGKQVYVTAEDWVTSARYILDPANGSEVNYLWHIFVAGSEDYTIDMGLYQICNSASSTADAKEEAGCEAGKVYSKPDFSKVGVKAIDAETLQFTLDGVKNYFPSVLTYTSYLPTNEQFIQSIGGFGQYGVMDEDPRDNIAYNGAYYLSQYQEDSLVVYKKNNNYWDKDNVFLKTVRLMYVPEDATPAWARAQYESGNLSGYRVQPADTHAWRTIVEGCDAEGNNCPAVKGTLENPHKDNAYVTRSTGDATTFYLGWNYNRPLPNKATAPDSTKSTNGDLNYGEVKNFEKALANQNFRKALFYAVDRTSYVARYTVDPTQWLYTSYVPNDLVYDDNGKDYVEYFQEVVAQKQGISASAAKAGVGAQVQGLVYNAATAKAALNLAKQELGSSVTWPVKVEAIFSVNATSLPYVIALENSVNNALGSDVNFTCYKGTSVESTKAFYDKDFSGYIQGWGPDYADPMTFANTFMSNGDLAPGLGLGTAAGDQASILSTYHSLVKAADAKLDKVERYKAFAEAEYELLFGQYTMVPLFQRYQGLDVRVGKVEPFRVQRSMIGSVADKFKGMRVLDKEITKEDYNKFKADWEAGKK